MENCVDYRCEDLLWTHVHLSLVFLTSESGAFWSWSDRFTLDIC